jgi:uncharacterized protein (TIGR02266 family)
MLGKSASEKQSERRIFPRLRVALTAHFRIGNRFVRDAVGDLSIGGLYLKTREPAREGTQVRVAMALPFEEGPRYCTLAGLVARIDRDHRGFSRGLGVNFDGDPNHSKDLEALKGFLLLKAA